MPGIEREATSPLLSLIEGFFIVANRVGGPKATKINARMNTN